MSDVANVVRNIERITIAKCSGNYDKINQHLTQKKIAWYEQNKNSLNVKGTDVRKAYEILLFRYMKINPKDIKVMHEDDNKIVWRSYNWCPVLEAAKRLGADTREVCSKGWEESNQKLIELINPRLKFSRNYLNLRPYGKYCEEQIELVE